MANYEVYVGNIGMVYSGSVVADAERVWRAYLDQSKSAHGRASGEPVTIMQDGEIVREYNPETEQPNRPNRIVGVDGSWAHYGEVTLTYNPTQGPKLVSPDKKLQALPCESCSSVYWVKLNVVAFLCDDCQLEQAGMNNI